MKKFLLKVWSNRAFRTFIQGFIGVFAGVQIFDLKDVNVVKTLIISGIMACISAVMSLNTGEEPKIVVVDTLDMEAEQEDIIEEE